MGALLAAIAKAVGFAGKGLAAGGKGILSAGKGAGAALGGLNPNMGSGLLEQGAAKLGMSGGGGGSPLQGLFDTIGGVKPQAPGKLGQIAGAQKPGNMGFLGGLRANGAQGLQSGLKEQVAGGFGGGAPKQAGNVSFPTVQQPSMATPIEPLPPMELPDRSQLSALRAQILQELLSGQGGGGF